MDNIDLLKVIADPDNKVCRFLHLSMQHASDNILEKMNRHYSFAQYADFVGKARELVPDIHIGTDIIAGFPGESDEDFELRDYKPFNYRKSHAPFSFGERFLDEKQQGTVFGTVPCIPFRGISGKNSYKLNRKVLTKGEKRGIIWMWLAKANPVFREWVSLD